MMIIEIINDVNNNIYYNINVGDDENNNSSSNTNLYIVFPVTGHAEYALYFRIKLMIKVHVKNEQGK